MFLAVLVNYSITDILLVKSQQIYFFRFCICFFGLRAADPILYLN